MRRIIPFAACLVLLLESGLSACSLFSTEPVEAERPAIQLTGDEEKDWLAAKDSKEPELIQAFIDRYPGGKYRKRADLHLKLLARETGHPESK